MTTALANTKGLQNPLKDVDPNAVLNRYLAGETSTEIAATFDVTKQALSYWLINKAETEWKSVQLVKALTRKEQADQIIETAANPLDLARGREMLRSAQWDLERVCRRIYGQDQPPAGAAQVAIQINLRRSDATVAVQHGDSAVIDGSVDRTKP